LGQPIFMGESSVDQLVEIIKILGTPTKNQILKMNPEYTDSKFPAIKPYPWAKVFKNKVVSDSFLDFVSKLLMYEPELRLTPLQALAHPFFDELREIDTLLPNNKKLPELFNFSKEEVNTDPELVESLIPDWYKSEK
jgi:glycogen synthase kinase 3 beta